jgi:protein-tyrosine-phosphatase
VVSAPVPAPPARPLKVLLLCSGNSARSQIAEALFTRHGEGRVQATSAGLHPTERVNPYAIEVLAVNGIAWDGHTPKGLAALQGHKFDLVITVCDDARDACPLFPGAAAQVHWGLRDPAEEQDPAAARRAFTDTYDALARRISRLLALPVESLPPAELEERAQAVHRAPARRARSLRGLGT